MMTNIALKNFKVFKDENFDLAPFTLVTGINGMGKSSIIQSLLLLKQSYDSNFLTAKDQVILDGDYVNLETAGSLCYEKAEERKVEICITEGKKTYRWIVNAIDSGSTILDVQYEGDSYSDFSLFQRNFIYLDAERFGPRKEYSKQSTRPFNTKIGVQGELAPSYLLNAITSNEQLGISGLKHGSQASTSLYQNLNAWLSDILGLNLQARVSDIDEQRLALGYNIQGTQGGNFSALQVGFGLTFSLPVILAPLIAKPGDLLLIENPEAHLHPTAQVKIGQLLALAAANGVQLIVESHSDHILNSLRYSYKQGILNDDTLKIIFIKTAATEKELVNYPEYIRVLAKGKLSHRPEHFFDVWDHMLTKLL
ncbi:AAA family ATPase [Flavisolibacter sp. BT320]|nr:AAA family ATPase [Flavisolibacter longurius]